MAHAPAERVVIQQSLDGAREFGRIVRPHPQTGLVMPVSYTHLTLPTTARV